MMCARLLRHTRESEQGPFYRASQRAFDRAIEGYGKTLAVGAESSDGHVDRRAGNSGADRAAVHRRA